MRDSKNSLKFVPVHSPGAVSDNTPQVGAIVDRLGFESLTYLIQTGIIADADATFTVLLEEGDQDDLSDAAAVADDNMIGTEAAAGFAFDDDNAVRSLGYIGTKRFTRLTITPSGKWRGSQRFSSGSAVRRSFSTGGVIGVVAIWTGNTAAVCR